MEEHLTAVKHILRYIRHTSAGLHVDQGEGMARLVGYSDNDLGGDINDHKSTSGTLFLLGGGAVTWQSQKQKIVALSSCESEYVAATVAAYQGIWLSRLLSEFRETGADVVKLKVDNKSAISLAKNPVIHDRSTHIELRHHFIRDWVETKKIELEFVATEHQLADMFTKPLGRVRLQ